MQDVFEEGPETTPPQGESKAPEQPQGAEQGQQPPQGAEKPPEGQGATPPVADTDKQGLLKALGAEREGRQDWKEKAIRAEAERDQLRQQWERTQQGNQPPQQQDPLQVLQQQIVNERFNNSELMVRDKFADVDEVVGVFKEAAARNPALAAQMHANPHPWKFAYEEGKRLKFATEIGNDPEAYRKKVRAEVEAELKAQPTSQSSAPAAPVIPQSLADARSAGARGTTFTGPTPFEDIFPN